MRLYFEFEKWSVCLNKMINWIFWCNLFVGRERDKERHRTRAREREPEQENLREREEEGREGETAHLNCILA